VTYPKQRTSYNNSGKLRIETRNRDYVEYKVRAGSNYTLGWDNNKGIWDMKFAVGSAAPTNVSNNWNSRRPHNRTTGRAHVLYDVRAGWKYNMLWGNRKNFWHFRNEQGAANN
jgi:hypothetical protein